MKPEILRITLLSILFGFLFPIVATVIEVFNQSVEFGLENIVSLHLDTPLLLIIDLAPFILGIFGFWLGVRQYQVMRANRKMRAAANRFFDMSIDYLAIIDKEGEIKDANPAMASIFGWDKYELRKKRIEELIHPDDLPEAESKLARLYSGVTLHEVELRFVTKTEATLYLSINASPADDDRFFIIARNVAGARESARLLKDARDQLRQFLEAVPIGIYVINGEGKPYYANQKSMELLGKGIAPSATKEDLSEIYQVYKSGTGALYPTEELPIVRALGGEEVHIDDMVVHRDGKETPLEVWARPVYDSEGKIIYSTVAFSDITEWRKMEAEIRNSEAFLDKVVENIPNMLFVKEANELRFVRFNKAGEELIDVPRTELIGKNDYDFFPKDQADFFTKKDREVFTSGELLDIPEEPIETQKKGTRLLHTKKVPIYDEGGNPRFLLGISEDITEKKATEEKIQEYVEKLETSNRNLDEFAYVVSHDLKAPLRAISNLSQWIIEDLEADNSEEIDEHVRLMKSRIKRMENLISDILAYSRVGRENNEVSHFDSGELVREVIDMIGHDSKAEFRVAEGMPQIEGKKVQMQQVFSNLINNAIKFSDKEKPIISVGHEKVGDRIKFTVADNGPGIAEEYREKVFGIFQRLQSKDEIEGSGLGLSIVRKIVENEGGTVSVDDDPVLGGARFGFSWRLSNQTPTAN